MKTLVYLETQKYQEIELRSSCEINVIHSVSMYSQVVLMRFTAFYNYLRVHVFAILLSFAEIVILAKICHFKVYKLCGVLNI